MKSEIRTETSWMDQPTKFLVFIIQKTGARKRWVEDFTR